MLLQKKKKKSLKTCKQIWKVIERFRIVKKKDRENKEIIESLFSTLKR